jgi:hypothetical protein
MKLNTLSVRQKERYWGLRAEHAIAAKAAAIATTVAIAAPGPEKAAAIATRPPTPTAAQTVAIAAPEKAAAIATHSGI